MGDTSERQVWANLWKLQIPSKIKILGWRALHGIIPCRGILANRHIGNDGGCPFGSDGCQDIKHIFFKCSRSRLIWSQLGVLDQLDEVVGQDSSGSVLVEEIINRGEKVRTLQNIGLAELFLTGAWYIWWERRKLVHGEDVQSPQRSALVIAALTTNYARAKKQPKQRRAGWKKPTDGKLMINVDASFDYNTGAGSTGAIIRDPTGGCIAAVHYFLPHVLDAPTAEAIALRNGLQLTLQTGFNRFIIQSDCMEVVTTMLEGGYSATAAGAIYEECYSLSKSFDYFSIEFCNREANQVAHELAKVALI